MCVYIIIHTILPPSPVILWTELGGKPKWLPLNFGQHDTHCLVPVFTIIEDDSERALYSSSEGQKVEKKLA